MTTHHTAVFLPDLFTFPILFFFWWLCHHLSLVLPTVASIPFPMFPPVVMVMVQREGKLWEEGFGGGGGVPPAAEPSSHFSYVGPLFKCQRPFFPAPFC